MHASPSPSPRPRRSELEQSLQEAQAELEALRGQRIQQMQLAESIVRQRDMYRVLLAQATGASFPPQGGGASVKHLSTHTCPHTHNQAGLLLRGRVFSAPICSVSVWGFVTF